MSDPVTPAESETTTRIDAPRGHGSSVATPGASSTAAAADDTATAPALIETPPEPRRAASAGAGRPSRVRKARLRLSRVDPWSVMKTAFLFSIAAGIMFLVATYLVWGVIGSSGLFDSINKIVSDIVNNPNDPNKFRIERYVSTGKVMGLSMILAVVDVVILTALATLGSFLYNLSATMLGGIEVTLAED